MLAGQNCTKVSEPKGLNHGTSKGLGNDPLSFVISIRTCVLQDTAHRAPYQIRFTLQVQVGEPGEASLAFSWLQLATSDALVLF